MSYESWRVSYQSSEQAARAAHAECERLRARVGELRQLVGDVHDRLLRGDSDAELLAMLEKGWGP